jgi:SAM-dependent methyltransferase
LSRRNLTLERRACTLVAMENGRTLASRLHGYIEQLFPNWTHRRYRHIWERRWLNPEFNPLWKTDQPQKELVDAIASGWFPKNQHVIDLGCGNGEVSRWLAGQGFAVLGLDYSAAAIENCRRLSAGHPNPPTFEVADLCDENLRLEPAFSLIDRGCFHRIVGDLRPVFARNIAHATVEGGHFLLLAGTFQDARVVNYSAVRSERQLREHVGEIFGNRFTIERAEPALINASEGQEATPAVAFWMVRKPKSPTSD